jgi:hypothetical protein
MIAAILFAVAIVLHLAIAIVLLRKYLRTRDIRLIWLGVAVVVWPLVSRLLNVGERVIISRIARHQTVDFYPFSLVEHGQITIGELATSLALSQQLIGVCLLLVAVLYLSKTNSPNDVHTAG